MYKGLCRLVDVILQHKAEPKNFDPSTLALLKISMNNENNLSVLAVKCL